VCVCVCVGFVMCGCVCGVLVMCGHVCVCVCVGVCVGFVMCGCFVSMYPRIYCVFVLFPLCIFILICFVCSSVMTTATE